MGNQNMPVDGEPAPPAHVPDTPVAPVPTVPPVVVVVESVDSSNCPHQRLLVLVAVVVAKVGM